MTNSESRYYHFRMARKLAMPAGDLLKLAVSSANRNRLDEASEAALGWSLDLADAARFGKYRATNAARMAECAAKLRKIAQSLKDLDSAL